MKSNEEMLSTRSKRHLIHDVQDELVVVLREHHSSPMLRGIVNVNEDLGRVQNNWSRPLMHEQREWRMHGSCESEHLHILHL